MASRIHLALTLLGSTALIGTAVAAPVAEGGRRFVVQMSGAQEVNPATGQTGAGDADGFGTATFVINVGQRRVCYQIEVENIVLPATGAHIHVGAAGTAPPQNIVIHLAAPNAAGESSGCIENLNRDLLRAIVSNPSNYYVNVHNQPFPGGAVRGQLSRSPR